MEDGPKIYRSRHTGARQQQGPENGVIQGGAGNGRAAFQSIQAILPIAKVKALQRIALNAKRSKGRYRAAKKIVVHVQRQFRIVEILIKYGIFQFIVWG